MMFSFLRDALVALGRRLPSRVQHLSRLREEGLKAWQEGEYHEAAERFQDYLETRPDDIEILNHLGCCYANVGRTAQASVVFQRACALDDTNLYSLLNRANVCVENKDSEEALRMLRQAMVTHLAHIACGQILSRVLFFRGDCAGSTEQALAGWLARFDDLRAANQYLFNLAYPDGGEVTLAIEHRFWGDTLKATSAQPHPAQEAAGGAAQPRRVRIGYWSPDFREHSVRFFSRPLIEGHDRERFELYAYHDYHQSDRHTEAIRDAVDHFHDVSGLKDDEVETLIVSHGLDVLVELAGHTSFNRLSMFARRLARLQMNGLGYPPTTGLRSMDGKIMDATICAQPWSPYYTERPLQLPSSLWCFDPHEDIPLRLDPPALSNGHVTFACMGNLAKLNPRTLRCWAQILEQVEASRLVVRAPNFQDASALERSRAECEAAGLPMDRVELLKPVGVSQLFQSYGDVDIVLDTFPFNGGTTSCFAAYMGVPVVSRFGESLVSRVGLSILTTLQLSHLAVDNDADYVRVAVALARDVEQLRAIRARARNLFQTTALGNGRLFAREFEAACLEWLAEPEADPAARPCLVPTLPADEMVRRAYVLRGHGNTDAAGRVINLCLQHHGDHANAHVFVAQQLAAEQSEQAGLDYLWPKIDRFAPSQQVPALIAAVHLMLRLGQADAAQRAVGRLSTLPVQDGFDRLQAALFAAALIPSSEATRAGDARSAAAGQTAAGQAQEPQAEQPIQRVCFIVPCQDEPRFQALRADLLTRLRAPEGGSLEVRRCEPGLRWAACLEAAEATLDLIVLLHPNVQILHPGFLDQVAQGLAQADVLSFAGAGRWERLDWRNDRFEQKSAGFLVPVGGEGWEGCELRLVGEGQDALRQGQAVLDGALLALRPRSLQVVPPDLELARCDTLMEELWSHEAGQRGLRLCAHRGLGVVLGEPLDRPDIQELSFGRQRLTERLGLDPLAFTTLDDLTLGVLLPDAATALEAARRFLVPPAPTR